jgi:hypothetical protein
MILCFSLIITFPFGIWIYCSPKSYDILHQCSNRECKSDLTDETEKDPSDDLHPSPHTPMMTKNQTPDDDPI